VRALWGGISQSVAIHDHGPRALSEVDLDVIIHVQLEGASHQSIAGSAGHRDVESIVSVSGSKDPRESLHVLGATLEHVEEPISDWPRIDREVDFKVDIIQNIYISHDGALLRNQWKLHWRQHRIWPLRERDKVEMVAHLSCSGTSRRRIAISQLTASV